MRFLVCFFLSLILLDSCKKKECPASAEETPALAATTGYLSKNYIHLSTNFSGDTGLVVECYPYKSPVSASTLQQFENCDPCSFNNSGIQFLSGYYGNYWNQMLLPIPGPFLSNFNSATIAFNHPHFGSVSLFDARSVPVTSYSINPAFSLSASYTLNLGVVSNCNSVDVSLNPYLVRHSDAKNTFFSFNPSELSGVGVGDTCYMEISFNKDTFVVQNNQTHQIIKSLSHHYKIPIIS